MSRNKAVTGDTCVLIMKALLEAVKEKHRGKLLAGVLLLCGNVPDTGVANRKVLSQNAWSLSLQSTLHRPYSPDLALSVYFQFANLNKFVWARIS